MSHTDFLFFRMNSNLLEITESDRKRAADELNEDESSSEAKIESFREMIKSADWYNSVLEPRLDSKFLLRFLRVAKFNLDPALTRIENYFKIQKEWKEVFQDFSLNSIEEYFRNVLILV